MRVSTHTIRVLNGPCRMQLQLWLQKQQDSLLQPDILGIPMWTLQVLNDHRQQHKVGRLRMQRGRRSISAAPAARCAAACRRAGARLMALQLELAGDTAGPSFEASHAAAHAWLAAAPLPRPAGGAAGAALRRAARPAPAAARPHRAAHCRVRPLSDRRPL